MQQWVTRSDLARDRMPLFRYLAGPGCWDDRLSDLSTVLRLRHVLETHNLADRIPASVRSFEDSLMRICVDVCAVACHECDSTSGNERETHPEHSAEQPYVFSVALRCTDVKTHLCSRNRTLAQRVSLFAAGWSDHCWRGEGKDHRKEK